MFKRHLLATMIVTSLVLIGCSSSDDDDGSMPTTDSGDATDAETGDDTDSVDATGETEGDSDSELPAIIAGETVISISNPVNVTGGANASVHLIHAGQGESALEVINNDQLETPLITDGTGPVGQLSFDTRNYVLISLSPQSNKLDFISGYYSGMNREPSLTANLDVAAGSSTIVVARGTTGDPIAPFELVGFSAEPANSELAKVRVVHAARGFNIVNMTTCNNCETNELDVYITTGTELTAEPLRLSYAEGDTGYVLAAPGVYNITITEAGNADNVRVSATSFEMTAGSVQTLVAVDGPVFGSSIEFIRTDDLQQ